MNKILFFLITKKDRVISCSHLTKTKMENQTQIEHHWIKFVQIYIVARFLYLFIFSIGIIGNLLSLMIFFRKKLFSSSYSLFLIGYSINSILNLTVGLFLDSLKLGFAVNWESTIGIYCKIVRYLAHVSFHISSCLLTMMSINRFARVRQAQLTKNQHRYVFFVRRRTTWIIIVLTIVFCFFINAVVLILFEIENDECYARPGVVRFVFDSFFFTFYVVLPTTFMIIINIFTVRAIRSIRSLVQPKISKREYQFIVIVMSQTILNFISILPFSINKFLHYSDVYKNRSDLKKLINSICLLLASMNPGLSFFLYTLITPTFRKEFFCIIDEFICQKANILMNTKVK